jgi:hypothetical protein
MASGTTILQTARSAVQQLPWKITAMGSIQNSSAVVLV